MTKGHGNLPLLVRNTCDGLTEGGQKLYLDLLDRFQGWSKPEGERQAFALANRYDAEASSVLDHIFANAALFQRGPHICELKRFIAERWKNNFMDITSHG